VFKFLAAVLLSTAQGETETKGTKKDRPGQRKMPYFNFIHISFLSACCSLGLHYMQFLWLERYLFDKKMAAPNFCILPFVLFASNANQ